MKIRQQDIIEVNYLFPDGTTKPHMAIVVSNDELSRDRRILLFGNDFI